jgi:Ca2+-binding EF-hand superfamily protein
VRTYFSPLQDRGGVFVSEVEIETAVRWLSKGRDKLTLKDLRDRLSPFYPDMPISELKFLMGDKKELTSDDIHQLLKDNTITNFDPVSEAFDVFDIDGTGSADLGYMSSILQQLGFDKLTDEDRDVIMKTADIDGDGRVSKEDFRAMLVRSMKGAETRAQKAKTTGTSGELHRSDSDGALSVLSSVASQ